MPQTDPADIEQQLYKALGVAPTIKNKDLKTTLASINQQAEQFESIGNKAGAKQMETYASYVNELLKIRKHRFNMLRQTLIFALVPIIFYVSYYSPEIDLALKKQGSNVAKVEHRERLEKQLNICAQDLLKKKMGTLTSAEIKRAQEISTASPYKDHDANEFKQLVFTTPLSPFYETTPIKLTVKDGANPKSPAHTYNGESDFKIVSYSNNLPVVEKDPTFSDDKTVIMPYNDKDGAFHALKPGLQAFVLSSQPTMFNLNPDIQQHAPTSVKAEMKWGQSMYAQGKAEIAFTTDAKHEHITFYDGSRTLVQKKDGTIGYVDHSASVAKSTKNGPQKDPMLDMQNDNRAKLVQAFADRLVEQKGRELTMDDLNAGMKAFDSNSLAGINALNLMNHEDVTRSPFFAKDSDTVMINGEAMPVQVFTQVRPLVFQKSDGDLIPFKLELELRKQFDQIAVVSTQVLSPKAETSSTSTSPADTSILGRMKAGWTNMFTRSKPASAGSVLTESRFVVAYNYDGTKMRVLGAGGKELRSVGANDRDMSKTGPSVKKASLTPGN